MLAIIALTIIAYLLGSVSSAIIVCRLMRLPDPRTEGSSNPGATNVMRIGGKLPAAITLIGDMLKGFLPVLVGHLLGFGGIGLAAVGLAAFLGHLFPIFFKFQGGKGVATALGIQFALYWPIGATVTLLWLLIAKVFKVSSLAGIISMALAPVAVWFWYPDPTQVKPLIGMQLIVSGILLWRHRGNIRRLLEGHEDKIGKKN